MLRVSEKKKDDLTYLAVGAMVTTETMTFVFVGSQVFTISAVGARVA